jgi:aspartate aminotransferase
MRTATRNRTLPVSELHEIHRLVERLGDCEGRSILRLHVGEPGFKPPDCVRAAVAKAIRDGCTGYTSAEGLTLLRERLAEKISRQTLRVVEPEHIAVTPGSTQGLFAIMLAMCDSEDEILIPETYWPIYAHAASIAGLRIRFYPLALGYHLDPDLVITAATPRTRILIINSPGNPTGNICDKRTLSELVHAAHNKGWWVISDEAYEHFVYDGTCHSPAALERNAPEADRRVFVLHSFSKSYGMTGYRVGYVVAPSCAAAAALRRVQEGSILAPSTPMQHGALAALSDDAFVEKARTHLVTNRLCLEHATLNGLLTVLPQGGWYALLDISDTGLSSEQFAGRLLSEFDVAVAPGSAFVPIGSGDPCTIRIAFCGDCNVVREGMARICTLAKGRPM